MPATAFAPATAAAFTKQIAAHQQVKPAAITSLLRVWHGGAGEVVINGEIYHFDLTPGGKIKTTGGRMLRYYGSIQDAAAGIAGVGA